MQPLPPTQPGEPPLSTFLAWRIQEQLGSLMQGQSSALQAIERSRVENHQRHDRIEERLWDLERPRAAPAPQPVSPTTDFRPAPTRMEFVITAMQLLISLLKHALPLALLAALVAGKLTHPEALPLIRQALGIQ